MKIGRNLKRFLPKAEEITRQPGVRYIAHLLASPSLWRFNSLSCRRGAVLGWYFCFVPMPMQMLPTFLIAPFFGCNLPIAIALVWVSNPFTYAPIFGFSYGIGNLLLGRGLSFPDVDWTSFGSLTGDLYLPMFLGGQVFGLTLGLVSYILIRAGFRIHKVRRVRRIRGVRAG